MIGVLILFLAVFNNCTVTFFSCWGVSMQMHCLAWFNVTMTLTTSEAFRDYWDRRYRKIKIIAIINETQSDPVGGMCVL